ncbi:hypothetical protein HDU97_001357 [Phlyctochytrium planicorne]|nr:hypothetical protein HDU97_001357 [Phlyctochytrium planicorne]
MHIHSPLVKAPAELARGLNVKSVYFKLDNLQPSGSFKIRGISYLIRETIKRNKNAVIVSSSGGNAGMAAALASQHEGAPCHVFVPSTTSELVKTRLRGLGANVVVAGNVWNEANEAAKTFVASIEAEKGAGSAKLVHPFDDLVLWEGHASLATEIVDQLNLEGVSPDAILCSVGGGGLLAGILTGLISLPAEKRPILFGVETNGAASFHAALTEGEGVRPIQIPAIASIAKSLGSLCVAPGLLKLRQNYGADRVKSLLVSDRQALDAVIRFANDERMLVEPACGASLAPIYNPDIFGQSGLGPDSVVVILVCGGSGVTLDFIREWDASVQTE